MLALPFRDDAFDAVVSSVAIHNVKGAERRMKAIDEAVRVLRHGGCLMIADIFAVSQYRERLRAKGMSQIQQRKLGWRMWSSGPWGATSVVTATKPTRA
jgi:arsenite methyltransferase